MGLALAGGLALHTTAHATTHRAALVIEHGVGWPGPHIVWKCVEFAQATISGLALLELAGMNSGQPPQVYDWGGGALTVCQINGEPRHVPERCFGPVSGPNWADWQATGAGWLPRGAGASGYSVRDGDLEGWTYSTGYGGRPPSVTFTQVCPASATPTHAVPRASAAAKPVQPPVVPATATPSPTSTPVALLPSASATTQPTVAAADASPPRPSGGSPPMFVLIGVAVLLLSGLFAWNFQRRAS